ncbi:hypothetical protein AZE42_08523 [Rhizopogon vesiculosus]|uniref:Uncharacterized protein n=1 Tax=Rhizopogon vesiculosus TaxID=180088 RepID=A0A1J8Q1C4_9AGAM|nr:hypothetical protein AZE42_08523 [Rhizopogon vesiculosus]
MPLAVTLLANAVDIAKLFARDKGKELASIGTKSASIHTTLFYKAFINIESDAITDTITEYCLSFVICELKPALPMAEAVNWLIVEQTYVR